MQRTTLLQSAQYDDPSMLHRSYFITAITLSKDDALLFFSSKKNPPFLIDLLSSEGMSTRVRRTEVLETESAQPAFADGRNLGVSPKPAAVSKMPKCTIHPQGSPKITKRRKKKTKKKSNGDKDPF